MEDKQMTPKSQMKNGIVYASILLLSTAAAAGFIFTIREPKPDWMLVQYEVLMVRAPRGVGDQPSFGKSIVSYGDPKVVAYSGQLKAPGLPQKCHVLSHNLLLTGDRMQASFLPESRLRLDFVPRISKQAAYTDLTIYQPGLKSSHRLVLNDGETRYLPIPSVDNSTDERIYAAVTVRAVGDWPAFAPRRAAFSSLIQAAK